MSEKSSFFRLESLLKRLLGQIAFSSDLDRERFRYVRNHKVDEFGNAEKNVLKEVIELVKRSADGLTGWLELTSKKMTNPKRRAKSSQ